ncbi:MAG: hypothetical protein JXA77_12340 [Bacteroidales bacterium]|nr:hypothetical protein [Bacteroidales bacterium]MBN2818580.1 hypothetical protein [Bacteroidales bacterium]
MNTKIKAYYIRKTKFLIQNITLLFFISITNLTAQNDIQKTINNINFGTGYSHLRMLDRQVTQLVYSANCLPISLGYSGISQRSIFQINLCFEPGMIGSSGIYKNRKVILESTNSSGVLESQEFIIPKTGIFKDVFNVSYHHRIFMKDSKFSFYAGGTFVQYFYLSFSVVPILFMSEISLNPSLIGIYKLNETIKVEGNISFPVFGINTRLPYCNDPVDGEHGYTYVTFRTGSRIASFNNYQKMVLNLEIEKQLSSKWSVSADYRFYWFRYSQEKTIQAYDNSVSLNLKRKILK